MSSDSDMVPAHLCGDKIQVGEGKEKNLKITNRWMIFAGIKDQIDTYGWCCERLS